MVKWRYQVVAKTGVPTLKKRAPKQVSVDRHRLTFAILRLIKGLSPSEVAAKSGVSYQTVVNMRKPVEDGGTLAPRISVVDKIARAFGQKLQLVDVHEPKMASKHSAREDRVSASAYN